jgi:hypothetical protein
MGDKERRLRALPMVRVMEAQEAAVVQEDLEALAEAEAEVRVDPPEAGHLEVDCQEVDPREADRTEAEAGH